MIAQNAHHPARGDMPVLLRSQELVSTGHAALGGLQRPRQVNVSQGKVEVIPLMDGPPALLDRIVRYVRAGHVPFRPDAGLVGYGGNALGKPLAYPATSNGLEDPGFLCIRYDVGVVVASNVVGPIGAA